MGIGEQFELETTGRISSKQVVEVGVDDCDHGEVDENDICQWCGLKLDLEHID